MTRSSADATQRDLRDEPPGSVRRFRLVSQDAQSWSWQSTRAVCTIGSLSENDVALSDPKVSRFHCELRVDEGGARVRDLGSTNGTHVDGVRVIEAYLRDGSALRFGDTVLRFELLGDSVRLPLSERTSFGGLVGSSIAMREVFALLERVAESEVTVLLEGETGTGKSDAAEAIHNESARRERPFVVLDCGAVPEALLESELFGHEKGAFTSADARRAGVLEEAEGGTLFLDEIGELPTGLQPKLLRLLETREYRRVGGGPRTANVRVIAGTNRDLRAEVNEGRFRSDLFFRLAVVQVVLPPLRARPEDVPMLVDTLLERLGAPADSPLREPGFVNALSRAAWPGNVRELRNVLERSLVYRMAIPPQATQSPAPLDGELESLPFSDARDRAMARFERAYFERLLKLHSGNVRELAAAAGISRVYLYKLFARLGLKTKS